MSELDVLLRESLGRLAEPGDPTGVAQAIRARVEAAGSSGAGGSGGAGGGGGGGLWSGPGGAFWSGPAAVGILIGLSVAGGAALGLSGAVGRPDAPPNPPTGPAAGIVQGQVWALGCPGGAQVESLPPGTRVLAMERSDDGGFVSVRDPYALAQTVWLPIGVLVPDAGAGSYADLPVGGCVVPSAIPSPTPSPTPSEAPAPAPVPEPAPKPTNKPKPPPAPGPDTQAPSASAGAASPSPLYGNTWSCGAHAASVTVTASDNVGVTSVDGSADFPGVSVALQSHSGNSWVFTVSTPGGQPSMGSDVTVHLSFTAHDGAGNTAGASSSFTYAYCLI